MRIVDVCAFYSPTGGGVRTYVDAKLRAASKFGHELIVIAPGRHEEVVRVGPGALIATIPSPRLPVDGRYRYFDDAKALHRTLDYWNPDHVESSSPWSSATMVGRWQGAATRSLFMHSDPLAAYAYRWLGGIAPIQRIDRWFEWFWKHLRGLGMMFDAVIGCSGEYAGRLRSGGVQNVETIRLGVEGGIFSPALRSPQLRAAAFDALGLDEGGILLLGAGRFSGEKRWDLVIQAVGECARKLPVGLMLVGDGPKRHRLEILAERYPTVAVFGRVEDRAEFARFLASGDGLIHGCESETFCLVAAEARASGIPLIVPDRGAAVDQLVPGAGLTYPSGSERALQQAIVSFMERGTELQRGAALRECRVRSMDEHFAELFARYEELVHVPLRQHAAEGARMIESGVAAPALAVARSSL